MKIFPYMKEKIKIINDYLTKHLPLESQNPSLIHRSIRYSVLNGGKRIRPILTIMTAELLDQPYENVLPTAAGIELIHTFSLIHDDLPSMDNDNYRRDKLANHKVFGEAMAILTGDALLVIGFDFICKNSEINGIRQESVIRVLKYVIDKIGTLNMLGGQVDDINWKNLNNNGEYIKEIYLKKTAALIQASLISGAILSQATNRQILALEEYGKNLGMAFQIIDDLLDVQQDRRDDEKATYPEIFGIENAKSSAIKYCNKAKESVSIFGDKAYLFKELADFVVKRGK